MKKKLVFDVIIEVLNDPRFLHWTIMVDGVDTRMN